MTLDTKSLTCVNGHEIDDEDRYCENCECYIDENGFEDIGMRDA